MRPATVPVGLLCALALVGASSGCSRPHGRDLRIAWNPVPELDAKLPPSIRVLSAADPSIPLRAYAVRADLAAGDIEAHVAVSTDDDLRESPTDFAARTGARVVVNAGYFRLDVDPTSHVGLLMIDGKIVSPPLRSVLRGQQRFYLARGALGIFPDGHPDIAWVSGRDGVLYEWSRPPVNAPDHPAPEPDLDGLPVWPVRDAVAAGPVLVQSGEIAITSDEEVFFGSSIPDVHPRTAACVDEDEELVLVVIDGRQRESRGVDLLELATIMRDLGCREAINLDGGGSSALVIDGALVSHPTGSDAEREVMSALLLTER